MFSTTSTKNNSNKTFSVFSSSSPLGSMTLLKMGRDRPFSLILQHDENSERLSSSNRPRNILLTKNQHGSDAASAVSLISADSSPHYGSTALCLNESSQLMHIGQSLFFGNGDAHDSQRCQNSVRAFQLGKPCLGEGISTFSLHAPQSPGASGRMSVYPMYLQVSLPQSFLNFNSKPVQAAGDFSVSPNVISTLPRGHITSGGDASSLQDVPHHVRHGGAGRAYCERQKMRAVIRASTQVAGRLVDYVRMGSQFYERAENIRLQHTLERYDKTGKWFEVIATPGGAVINQSPPSQSILLSLRSRLPDIRENNTQQYRVFTSNMEIFPPKDNFDYAVRASLDGLAMSGSLYCTGGSALFVIGVGGSTTLGNYASNTTPDNLSCSQYTFMQALGRGINDGALGMILPIGDGSDIDLSRLDWKQRSAYGLGVIAADLPVFVAAGKGAMKACDILSNKLPLLTNRVVQSSFTAAAAYGAPQLVASSRREYSDFKEKHPDSYSPDATFYKNVATDTFKSSCTGAAVGLVGPAIKAFPLKGSIAVGLQHISEAAVLTSAPAFMSGELPDAQTFFETCVVMSALHYNGQGLRFIGRHIPYFNSAKKTSFKCWENRTRSSMYSQDVRVNDLGTQHIPNTFEGNSVGLDFYRYRGFEQHPISGFKVFTESSSALSIAQETLPLLFDSQSSPGITCELSRLAARKASQGDLRIYVTDPSKVPKDSTATVEIDGKYTIIIRPYLELPANKRAFIHEISHCTLPGADPSTKFSFSRDPLYSLTGLVIEQDHAVYRKYYSSWSPVERRVGKIVLEYPNELPDREGFYERFAYGVTENERDMQAFRKVCPNFSTLLEAAVLDAKSQRHQSNSIGGGSDSKLWGMNNEVNRSVRGASETSAANKVSSLASQSRAFHTCAGGTATDTLSKFGIFKPDSKPSEGADPLANKEKFIIPIRRAGSNLSIVDQGDDMIEEEIKSNNEMYIQP